jgi:formylmethanofuran dehydrogenase subunit E
MAKVDPFHTDSPEYPPSHRDVFHDQSECSYGKEIKLEHRRAGEGGRPLCKECERLGSR